MQIAAIATALRSRGIAQGDRVAIMAANSDHYVLLLFALAKTGAIAVPINPELQASEAAYIFQHASVTAVVCTPETLATARVASAELSTSPWFFFLEGSTDSLTTIDDLHQSPATERPAPATPDDTFLILYTSGTTGFPKGVMHSQCNFVLAGEAFVERMHLQPDDRLLVVLPLFHINALFYSLGGAVAAGASLLLAPIHAVVLFWRMAAEGARRKINIMARLATSSLAGRAVNLCQAIDSARSVRRRHVARNAATFSE